MSVVSLQPMAPVNISRVLQGAAVFDFKRHQSHQSFMDSSNISLEAEELFELLETRGVPYLLVGGLAMLTHVRGRTRTMSTSSSPSQISAVWSRK